MTLFSTSREESSLFNPAFLGLVLSETTRGHREQTGLDATIPIAFAGATVAMFKHLRASLPRTTRTHLAKWVTDHPDFNPGFQRLLNGSLPALRAGLIFASHNQLVTLHGASLIALGSRKSLPSDLSEETVEVLRVAGFTGRWFGKAGTTATTLSVLGFES